MVMAAGLGTRLAPLTDHVPKPLVPVCNRPVLEHLLRLLARHGVRDVAVNLHHHADAIRDAFGDGEALGLRIRYRFEPRLLGTAGGTRGFREFLVADGEPFLVVSSDGLHDVDLDALAERHRATRAVATLTVKQIPDPERYGVVVLDRDGLVQGFQEKPPREEARSDLASCGVYVFEPRVLDGIPAEAFRDWAQDVLPALMRAGERLAAYTHDGYWNDVGSIQELLNGNLDPLRGVIDLDLGELVDETASIADDAHLEGPVLVGAGAQVEAGALVVGPAVLGPDARVGRGASLRAGVLLPGGVLADEAVQAGGIGGTVDGLCAWRRGQVAAFPSPAGRAPTGHRDEEAP
jgi:NDP-sugar pyrophosphorylase family protein